MCEQFDQHFYDKTYSEAAVFRSKVIHINATTIRCVNRQHAALLSLLQISAVSLQSAREWVYSVSDAKVWNDLPPHVTSAPSLAIFRQRLKSFLFSQSYSDIHT